MQLKKIGDMERVKYYLELWKEFMRRGQIDVGFRKKSSIFATGGINRFEDLANEADISAARAMDAIISDLPLHQQAAVYHFNLDAVFRFTRLNIDEVYADALVAIEIGIRKKCLP